MGEVRIGQHFLVNINVAKKIVKHFFPVNGTIVEIGPGKGVLTDLLIEFRRKNKIIAIELDKKLYEELYGRKLKNFEVLHSDILDVDLDDISKGKRVSLVANVPYYISKELIDWVIFQEEKIDKGIFMMQLEFVNKLISTTESSRRNARSVIFGHLFFSRKLFDVNPGSFYPIPLVRSTVFLFQRLTGIEKKEINIKEYYSFLKTCFRNRRKTLFNNLISVYSKSVLKDIFENNSIDLNIRAEMLACKTFCVIYSELKKLS